MSGCEGCFLSAKGQARELDIIIQEAKTYAKENNITAAIIKEGTGYNYTTAERAHAAGLPIIQYISKFNGTAAT